jgi:putative oxidoreductase
MKARLDALLATRAPAATILVRLTVGGVFVSEGIQKFLFPASRGAGRFAEMGLWNPDLLGPLVGGTEIVCGSLVLAGLLTRLAVVPLTIVMLVAITTTKLPMLSSKGFWHMAHESRTDLAMLLGAIFLGIVGAGRLSLDEVLRGHGDPSGSR